MSSPCFVRAPHCGVHAFPAKRQGHFFVKHFDVHEQVFSGCLSGVSLFVLTLLHNDAIVTSSSSSDNISVVRCVVSCSLSLSLSFRELLSSSSSESVSNSFALPSPPGENSLTTSAMVYSSSLSSSPSLLFVTRKKPFFFFIHFLMSELIGNRDFYGLARRVLSGIFVIEE
eukprot:Lithocolla_globosa_v1_NODE_123_length_6073_cov_7.341808.p2 type:complete len:171 gc:universal NODE_123_length_6073_cov_7.341808:3921-4433(+)